MYKILKLKLYFLLFAILVIGKGFVENNKNEHNPQYLIRFDSLGKLI